MWAHGPWPHSPCLGGPGPCSHHGPPQYVMLPDSPGCLKVPVGPRTLPCALVHLWSSALVASREAPPPPHHQGCLWPGQAELQQKVQAVAGGGHTLWSLLPWPTVQTRVGLGPPPALWPETGGSCQPSPLAAACPSEQVSAARRPPCLRAHMRPLCAHSLKPQLSRMPPLPMVSACLSLVTQRPPWQGLQPLPTV